MRANSLAARVRVRVMLDVPIASFLVALGGVLLQFLLFAAHALMLVVAPPLQPLAPVGGWADLRQNAAGFLLVG